MTLDAFLADPGSRFATVAMTDTNGLLRGQMVSASALKGIAKAGMGMAPAQLALDPTDVHLTMPGVNDDAGDFHDDPLLIDPASVRRLPWSKPGHDLLVLSNFTGASAELCPRSILTRVLARAADRSVCGCASDMRAPAARPISSPSARLMRAKATSAGPLSCR